MRKPICIGLLALSGVLLFWGYNASESFGSEVSRIISGSPTDQTMWLVGGGVLAGATGLAGLLLPKRSG